MYVVRITYSDEDEPPNFKVFTALSDALKLFREADKRVILDGVSTVSVFQSAETNARTAVESINAGKATLLKQDTIRTLKL